MWYTSASTSSLTYQMRFEKYLSLRLEVLQDLVKCGSLSKLLHSNELRFILSVVVYKRLFSLRLPFILVWSNCLRVSGNFQLYSSQNSSSSYQLLPATLSSKARRKHGDTKLAFNHTITLWSGPKWEIIILQSIAQTSRGDVGQWFKRTCNRDQLTQCTLHEDEPCSPNGIGFCVIYLLYCTKPSFCSGYTFFGRFSSI